LPAATNYTISSRALYTSRQHGKEIVGNIALERGETGKELLAARSWPALRQLLYLKTTVLRQETPEFFNQCLEETMTDVIKGLEIGGVLLHRDSVSLLQASSVDRFLREKMGMTAAQEDDLVLYTVEAKGLPVSDGVFVGRDGRWQSVGRDAERGQVAVLSGRAGLSVYNINEEGKRVLLKFVASEEIQAQSAGGSRKAAALEGVEVVVPARGMIEVELYGPEEAEVKLGEMRIVVNGEEAKRCGY
jgi:hypothetical protein